MDGGYAQVSNLDLPAGYTYFAQFVMHDLTSATTPRLQLRALYGRGPAGSPELYDAQEPGQFRLGRSLGQGTLRDLPRNRDGSAVTGDRRNDRTIMVGQIHAAFLQLHNSTMAAIGIRDRADAYRRARRHVERVYRSLVVNDLLPRLVDDDVLAMIRARRQSTHPRLLPLEFTLAVGRFGHAMVKPRYRVGERLQAALFRPDGEKAPFSDLRGQPLDERAAISWENFFPVGSLSQLQRAAKINTKICRPLFEMPGPTRVRDRSIAYLTLAASAKAGLSSGQRVARALGLNALTPETVWQGLPFGGMEAPLWFYVLREAELEQHGRRLGRVGSTILVPVILDACQASQDDEDRYEGDVSSLGTVGELLAAIADGEPLYAPV